MGPLGIKPPRLRVALIAVLAALAAMAVASPGVASAAPSVSLNCIPATVEPGKETRCLALVSTGSAGTPATGNVEFDASGATDFLDLGSGSCQVAPVSGSSGFCSLAISGLQEGKVRLLATYSGPTGTASDATSFTIASTAVVFCLAQKPVVGDATECRVHVPGVPGNPNPLGKVQFTAIGQGGNPPGNVDPGCTLHPAGEGSKCEVTFTPASAGKVALLAEYDGQPGKAPAQNAAQIIEVAAEHETMIEVFCDPQNPIRASRIFCGATISNISSGGSFPPGQLTLEMEHPSRGKFLGPPVCDLQHAGGNSKEASCVFRYETVESGKQTLEVTYPGAPGFEATVGAARLEVNSGGLGTTTEPVCEAVGVGEVGKCVVTVRGASPAIPLPPQGPVAFTSSADLVEFSSRSCEAIPLSEVTHETQCEVTYKSLATGPITIEAEFESNPRFYRLSKGQTTVVVN